VHRLDLAVPAVQLLQGADTEEDPLHAVAEEGDLGSKQAAGVQGVYVLGWASLTARWFEQRQNVVV
jgi:hypothetical protein